jgi:thioredoxin 1
MNVEKKDVIVADEFIVSGENVVVEAFIDSPGLPEENSENSGSEASTVSVRLDPETIEPSLPLSYRKEMDWASTIAGDQTIIFRFTAKWCKPCKGLDPFYNELSLSNTSPEVVYYNVDVDECDEIAALNGALTIPLFVSYRSGEQLGKLTGSDTKKITKFVNESIKLSKQ